MFFAPPKVKSLSRYSEFGSHLGEKEFLMMIVFAMIAHAIIMALYSMKPHETATIIPVRVLNIKLDAGAAGLDMPKLSDMPGYVPPPPPDAEAVHNQLKFEAPAEKPTQAAANKIYNNNKQKSLMSVLTQDKERRSVKTTTDKLFTDRVPSKPRKYVRENEINPFTKSTKPGGNGTDFAGTAGGTEIVTRYTQQISQWTMMHQIYPDAAKNQGIEGSPTVNVVIDRNGHVISKQIHISSGNALIDQAALDMVRDSDPMPKVPDNYPAGERFGFDLTLTFKLHKS